eukprot:317258_1
MATTWISLSQPPGFPGLLPTPTYYRSTQDNKEYFIITPHYANSSWVYQYNMTSDTFVKWMKYPSLFEPNCHGSALDIPTRKLYLYCGYSQHFGILDIEKKQWDIKWNKDCKLTKQNQANFNIPAISKVSSCYLPLPIDEIHLFGQNNDCGETQHLKYDKTAQKFIALKNMLTIDVTIQRPKMVWVKHQNMLMVFGGYNDKIDYLDTIYVCNIDENTTEYEWKIFEKKLPSHNKNKFEVIVAFETIIIVVYFGKGMKKNDRDEIWCLDLLSNTWIKSEVKSPCSKASHLVQTPYNYLHCIRFTLSAEHYKIKLCELIPSEFYKMYSKRYLILISGYCKQHSIQYDNDIPDDIVKLLLKYYPMFV